MIIHPFCVRFKYMFQRHDAEKGMTILSDGPNLFVFFALPATKFLSQ